VLCGNSQLSAAERADKLEHVLSRLEARDDLSAEQKAKVTAALREAIEKVRAGQ
jgi:ribosome assembly protein YihI (activator of Der GTPase)